MSDVFKSNGSQVSGEAGEGGATTLVSPPEIKFENISPPVTTTELFTAPVKQEERRGAVIAIDVDDTICNYVPGFVHEHGWPESFGRAYSNRGILQTQWPSVDLEKHFEDANHIEFCRALLPIDGAFSACHILLGNGFPIVYLSRRPASHKQMTLEWLRTWEFPVAPLFCAGSGEGKQTMMQNLDIAAIVDDNPEDIYNARSMGLATFIIDRPWNRDVPGLYRCFGWTHILGVIDKHWLPIGG